MTFDTKLTSLSSARVSGWTLNEIWSFLRPCLQVGRGWGGGGWGSRFPLKKVKDRPYYLGLNSGRSVSIKVNKTRKHFFQKYSSHARMFPQFFPVYHTGTHCFHYQFFQDGNMLTVHGREFLRKYQHASVAKILRARPGEHLYSSHFCEQFERTPNFASTFR